MGRRQGQRSGGTKPWTAFLKGSPKQRGRMNRTEAAYADELELRRYAGEVLWWSYESLKLRLGKGAWYTADFAVMLADGLLELVEVKGFQAEAAAVRLKVAAATYPFRFVKVTRAKGGGFRARGDRPGFDVADPP